MGTGHYAGVQVGRPTAHAQHCSHTRYRGPSVPVYNTTHSVSDKTSLLLKIEYSLFIPATVMYKVFHLFVLYGHLHTLCFVKKRPVEAQHSLSLLEFRLRVLLRRHL